MEEKTLLLIAEKHNLDWYTLKPFALDCYEQGRQSIFLAQASGRLKRKMEGKPLGRPKGSKDRRGVKRSLINKYKYLIKNSNFYSSLSDKSLAIVNPKIEQIQSKKDYEQLKEEMISLSVFDDFSRLPATAHV